MVDYKSVKIAIHHSPGSFSERWIAYCEEKHIPYKIVNAYDSDIIKQVTDCTAFMWHHHHTNYKDALFAKQLLYSLQIAGKKVFPDFDAQFFAGQVPGAGGDAFRIEHQAVLVEDDCGNG